MTHNHTGRPESSDVSVSAGAAAEVGGFVGAVADSADFADLAGFDAGLVIRNDSSPVIG